MKAKISESEWMIMKVLWSSSPLTSKDITANLEDETKWKENTVRTLLTRLVKKGAVDFEKEGRSYLYHPLQGEDECVREESRNFLQKVFGGAAKSMVASFIKNEEFSKEEIEDLKKLLDDQLKKR